MNSLRDPETRPRVEVWSDDSIGKVRVASTPGGDALSVEEAENLRDELDAAIEQARDE